ncbi:folylpolyglutamate synthase-like [Dioscorea cayenensis subsp. rotundata]|uniref:Folylpolyglutamate synthase n=1 Tax=Dioscorea cayennensis subsp. rotundata TaxID=55577 RepID=A0AB40BPP3_DIOCR|nr:folylpolyglutamate synthase-like [Dioscorea cayenensis subsp. rotundata]
MGFNGVIHGHLPQQTHPPSYEGAMEALSSLITVRKRGDGSKRAEKFDLMFKYLKVLGLEEKIDGLKIIHVAGTKGKGSTCTFSEAILRHCGFRTGLFTSPHLIDVRERYRINGLDISKDNFLLYFWDCWHQLKEKTTDGLPMPVLFQFLTLLAFKIFLSEKVDVAILEVGLGGGLDATNVVRETSCLRHNVTRDGSYGNIRITIQLAWSIIDQILSPYCEACLRDTLGKIASEKAGIIKSGVPAYTVPQLSEAMSVLQDRAATLMVHLDIALPLQQKMLRGLKLGLDGLHQFTNASLAVALCRCWLEQTKHHTFFLDNNLDAGLPEPFLQGLCAARLQGRAQIVHDIPEKSLQMPNIDECSSNLVFYLDGAHSPESMEICANWFSDSVTGEKNSLKNNLMDEFNPLNTVVNGKMGYPNRSNKISRRILLFNCMEARDPELLLPQLFKICAGKGIHFSKALFVPSMSIYYKVDPGLSDRTLETCMDTSWQSTLQRTWEKMIHGRDNIPENDSKLQKPDNLPSYDFLHGSSENCNPPGNNVTCSAVIPSLPLTIKWLRDCLKENPSFRLQVLVTGSLHLVGDVLKLIRR